MCNLRLSALSQETKGPGSGLMIFIRTDAFVNNFGNILGRILSLSHTQKQTFLSHFSFIFISSLVSFLLFSVPGTECGCLR